MLDSVVIHRSKLEQTKLIKITNYIVCNAIVRFKKV
jgi:hypothetical protein